LPGLADVDEDADLGAPATFPSALAFLEAIFEASATSFAEKKQ